MKAAADAAEPKFKETRARLVFSTWLDLDKDRNFRSVEGETRV